MKPSLVTLAKRTLLVLFLAAAAFAVGCLSGAQNQDMTAVENRLNDLQQDIDLLQEFNRLDLTKEQLQALTVQVDAIHDAMRAREGRRLDILNLLQALLEEQRAALLKDQPAPPAVCRQIEIETDKLKEFDQASDQELLKFAKPIKDLLKPEQVDILTWVSEARLQAAEHLDWVRFMSEADFKTEAEVDAEGLAEGRAITKAEIIDIYGTARAMDEKEYTQAKGKLADQLLPAFRDDTTPVDPVLIRRMQPERVPIVLKEKLAQMK
jgi:hypothetical protein